MASGAGAIESAQAALSKAQALTKSVEGTPESRFAPKPLNNQYAGANYSNARKARPNKGPSISDELKAKKDNIDQYAASQK